ncbi:MAG: hypothetical protein R2854_08910 [Caldilineaceae bacterium]
MDVLLGEEIHDALHHGLAGHGRHGLGVKFADRGQALAPSRGQNHRLHGVSRRLGVGVTSPAFEKAGLVFLKSRSTWRRPGGEVNAVAIGHFGMALRVGVHGGGDVVGRSAGRWRDAGCGSRPR